MNTFYININKRDELRDFILPNKLEHPVFCKRHFRPGDDPYRYDTYIEYEMYNGVDYLAIKLKYDWILDSI